MSIQVTYLERTREDPKIKNAKETKSLVCALDGESVRFVSSDYAERELRPLADEILRAVKNKKRLIKG